MDRANTTGRRGRDAGRWDGGLRGLLRCRQRPAGQRRRCLELARFRIVFNPLPGETIQVAPDSEFASGTLQAVGKSCFQFVPVIRLFGWRANVHFLHPFTVDLDGERAYDGTAGYQLVGVFHRSVPLGRTIAALKRPLQLYSYEYNSQWRNAKKILEHSVSHSSRMLVSSCTQSYTMEYGYLISFCGTVARSAVRGQDDAARTSRALRRSSPNHRPARNGSKAPNMGNGAIARPRAWCRLHGVCRSIDTTAGRKSAEAQRKAKEGYWKRLEAAGKKEAAAGGMKTVTRKKRN